MKRTFQNTKQNSEQNTKAKQVGQAPTTVPGGQRQEGRSAKGSSLYGSDFGGHESYGQHEHQTMSSDAHFTNKRSGSFFNKNKRPNPKGK